ncbi:helix-turn-helix transcriptional regulator [Berryella wangjianweii]|nr:LuxR C-terminal-related transcriptional regulator [Berryella wangjianweii]
MTAGTNASTARNGASAHRWAFRFSDIGMAFFWACSMLTFRSSVMLEGALDTTDIQTMVVVVSFIANMTMLILLAFWLEHTGRSLSRNASTAAFALASLGLVGIALVNTFQGALGGAVLPALTVSSAVTGAGYGIFWGSWAETLGKRHPSKLGYIMPLVFLVSAVAFLVVSIVVSDSSVPAVIPLVGLCGLSYGCLRVCEQRDRLAPRACVVRMQNSRPAFTSLFDLMALSIIVSFLFGFMWETTVLNVQSVNDAHRLPMFANLALAIVLVGIMLAAKRFVDFDMAYRFIIPTVIILLVILPLLWDRNPVLMNVLTTVGYGFFDVTMMYVAFAAAYDFAASGLFVGGLIRVISIFSRLAGIGIGYLAAYSCGNQKLVIMSVSAASVYALLIAWMIYRKNEQVRLRPAQSPYLPADPAAERAAQKARGMEAAHAGAASSATLPASGAVCAADAANPAQASPGAATGPCPTCIYHMAAPDPDALAGPSARRPRHDAPEDAEDASDDMSASDSLDVLELIAEDFGLTRREAEVLPHLTGGRSAKGIAQALYVSESTVRSHTQRIYRKANLHSRDDLLNLVQRYEAAQRASDDDGGNR